MAGIGPYQWDETKRAANLSAHKVDFTAIQRFDWETATFAVDRRRSYGEVRIIGVGRIGTRLHVVVFTIRGEFIRLISLRKANQREIEKHEKES